jgi:hypothetical protein
MSTADFAVEKPALAQQCAGCNMNLREGAANALTIQSLDDPWYWLGEAIQEALFGSAMRGEKKLVSYATQAGSALLPSYRPDMDGSERHKG